MEAINVKKIKDKIKSLKIPKEYWGIDLDSFFNYQYNMYISIRETAGKTTQSLILGLVLNSLYPDIYNIEYLRNDNSQIVRANIENLFNTIVALGYIEKIYDGKYNNVLYKTQQRKFFLIYKDDKGEVIDTSPEPICIVHALETAFDAKSGYNNPRGNYIVMDIDDTLLCKEFPEDRVYYHGSGMAKGEQTYLNIENINF